MPKSAEKKAAHADYDAALRDLQIQLVNMQVWAMAKGRKIVILFEGRDASGKDGTIKRIVEHLAVRNTRVVALPKPSDRDKSLWWFQRYVEHLPAAGDEIAKDLLDHGQAVNTLAVEFKIQGLHRAGAIQTHLDGNALGPHPELAQT